MTYSIEDYLKEINTKFDTIPTTLQEAYAIINSTEGMKHDFAEIFEYKTSYDSDHIKDIDMDEVVSAIALVYYDKYYKYGKFFEENKELIGSKVLFTGWYDELLPPFLAKIKPHSFIGTISFIKSVYNIGSFVKKKLRLKNIKFRRGSFFDIQDTYDTIIDIHYPMDNYLLHSSEDTIMESTFDRIFTHVSKHLNDGGNYIVPCSYKTDTYQKYWEETLTYFGFHMQIIHFYEAEDKHHFDLHFMVITKNNNTKG